jgi:hypothetical protein
LLLTVDHLLLIDKGLWPFLVEYLASRAGWLSLLGRRVELALTGVLTENLLALRRCPLQSSDVLLATSIVVDGQLLLLAFGH